MRTRITRPTLADLWRVLLADLERLGTGPAVAPGLARSLAVAGWTGRPAELLVLGVRVEWHGEDVIVTVAEPDRAPARPAARKGRALLAPRR